jgi:hypothetical protein
MPLCSPLLSDRDTPAILRLNHLLIPLGYPFWSQKLQLDVTLFPSDSADGLRASFVAHQTRNRHEVEQSLKSLCVPLGAIVRLPGYKGCSIMGLGTVTRRSGVWKPLQTERVPYGARRFPMPMPLRSWSL